MGKPAVIIQALHAEAPVRQNCRWRSLTEGNIKSFPDSCIYTGAGGGRGGHEFHLRLACKEFSLNGWDNGQVNCDGVEVQSRFRGKEDQG